MKRVQKQRVATAAPAGIDTVTEYQKLADVLSRWGYTDSDVENIMSRNWQRYIEDPELKAVKLICELARAAGDKAAIVDLDTFARRAKLRHAKKGTKSCLNS